ncbi:hypothetical protein BDA99DRAFT_538416 [Phascolomyces articulosus]|uniref:Calcium-channel protein CCH1 n=1 Tax=Phascolomyces articulosus TaxID=60185 RepID=A0AAD5PCM3_9FUNG|nr:hypothetical protein BDA99DRAFT_538416 [Phascolomyces articulosus]
MPDPEDEPKSQLPPPAPNIEGGGSNNNNHSPHSQPPSPQPVPQITLTAANDNQPGPSTHSQNRQQKQKHQRQPSSPITSVSDQQLQSQPQSPNSLSPILNRPSNINSPPPLPLTRDLLQRKNKLDKFLHESNKKRRSSHSQSSSAHPPPSPIMTFGADSNILLDERVTAGLGISTPSQSTSQPPTPTFGTSGKDHDPLSNNNNATSNLRHRRHHHQARPSLMTSATAIMDGDNRANRKSPPPSPQEPPYKWNYDFDFKNLSPNISNNSVREPMMIYSALSTGASSNTASSVYNNTPSKKMSPSIDYDEKKHHHHHFQHHYPSPPSSLPPPYSQYSTTINPNDLIYRRRTSRKILKHVYDSAARVVNLRGCEQIDTLLEDNAMDQPKMSFNYHYRHQQQNSKSKHNKEEGGGADDNNHSQQPYDTMSAHNQQYRPSDLPSTPLEKQSTHSRTGSIFAESISRFDKRSLFSDLPSATRHDSRHTAPETIDQQALPEEQKQNIPRYQSSPLAGNSLYVLPPDNSFRFYIWNNILCSSLEAICKIIVYGFWIPPDYHQQQKIWTYRTASLISQRLFGRSLISAENSNDDIHGHDSEKRTTKNTTFHHRAYFSGFANTIDFLAIISYWIDLGMMVHHYPYCSLFKALSALRPLRLLSLFRGTATILRSLLVSWGMLKDVIGFVLFFTLLFALIGLVSFKGVFSRRCYAVDDITGEQTIVDPPLFCSGYYNDSTIMGAFNVKTGVHSYPGYGGYICTNNQICLEDQAHNPNFGFVNYDTIYFALLSVYTSMSLELWTELMYQNQDADSNASVLFYCLVVYVISFLLIFLIFAVITSGFSRVRAANRVSAFTGKKKKTRMLRSVRVDDEQDELIWQYDDPENADQRVNGTRMRLKRLIVKMVKNTAFMCVRSVHASEETLEMLDNAETAFTFLFAFEIVLRMIGTPGWMQFWASGRNKFDLFLVIVTCVIQLPMIQDSHAYKYLTIFQCMRQYRLFICIPRVRRLLSAALGTGESVIYVVAFLLLCTALCSPIFMQLFGGDFGFIEQDESELRCDTFWESYLTLIMLYTSETWTDFLYNAMYSQPHFSAVYAALITSLYFAFARYVMAGLYIAVILENFELDDEEIKQYQIRQFIQKRVSNGDDRLQNFINKTLGSLYVKSDKSMVQIPRLPTNLTASMDRNALVDLLVGYHESIFPNENHATVKAKKSPGFFGRLARRLKGGKKQKLEDERGRQPTSDSLLDDDDDNVDDYELVVEEENRRAKQADMPTLKSLLIFSSRSKLRRWCKMLAGSTADGRTERRNLFNWFIMACVVVSILLVIMDEPSARQMRQDTYRESAANAVDIGLSIVFVIEIIIRIIADGFLLPPNAYLRNPWNRLDFVVVALNFGAIFAGEGDFARALSTVRSLRVLRLIRYFGGVRDVFVDLFHAFPFMMDALLLVFLVMIFFSIYGVNILGGRMVACNDDEVSGRAECVGEFLNDVGTDGPIEILQPRAWAIPEGGLVSYDDFPIALAQLFSLSSTEGWIDSLFFAMSAPANADIQPQFDWTSSSVYHSIYYVVFMVISHGTLQLFVGVIIEKFKQRAGITTMTTGQRQYADLQRQLAEIKPTPKAQRPNSKIRSLCYSLVADKRGPFNKLIMSIVILNICVIATEFQNEPMWLTRMQDYMYIAFCGVYTAEVIIKYLGLGWAKWSKSKWNWYDAFIALSALVLTISRYATPDLWTLRIERYCLVLAAFRLGEGIDSLQTLYHTVRLALPNIVRVTAVFILVMCLFAMVFMELFGLTKFGLETGRHANFRDYGNALSLLVRITTGEAWNVVMMDNTVQPPNCVYSDNYLYTDCGSPGWAYFLFNLYYLICTHIFLNLFTATVISNFEYAYETRSRFTRLTKDDLRSFKYAWSVVDPSGSGYIQKGDVAKFLRLLDGRLKMTIYSNRYSIKNLQAVSKKGMPAPTSPRVDRSIEKTSGYTTGTDIITRMSFNLQAVNKRLSKLDPERLRERRRDYNLYYLEIIDAATSKGISFEDVRTIMSYRFVDAEDALTMALNKIGTNWCEFLRIVPLIKRLEKLDQLHKAYAAEKARGLFLMMAQRKRYLHDLWQKKNDDEMRKLGINTRSGLQLDTSAATLSPKGSLSAEKWRQRSPVPTIIIQDAPPSPRPNSDYIPSPASLTVPVSPMSNYSFETQYGSPFMAGGGDSLNVAIGTVSPQASPYPGNEHDENSILLNGALSPNTPYSPTIVRQNWRVIDGNSSMSSELAESLMDSLQRSHWSVICTLYLRWIFSATLRKTGITISLKFSGIYCVLSGFIFSFKLQRCNNIWEKVVFGSHTHYSSHTICFLVFDIIHACLESCGTVNLISTTPNKTMNLLMLLTITIACMGGLLMGYDVGVISGVLVMPTFAPHFGMEGDEQYQAQVKGDIVSMLQAGCCIGGLLINLFADPFGRKAGIMLSAVVFIVGSVVQVVAPTVGAMMAGRFVGGKIEFDGVTSSSRTHSTQQYVTMGVGAASNIVPVFVAEIAPKHLRGRMANLWQFMVVLGIMVSYWVDYACLKHMPESDKQWKTPLGLQIVPGGILLLGMGFLPESLRWLASRDRIDQLTTTLSRLRGLPEDHELIIQEVTEIHESILEERANKSNKWAELLQRSNIRRLIIGVMVGVCQQWTGTNAINYYAPQIFRQIGLTGETVDILATGIYGVVKVVFVFVFFFMVDHPFFGRRNSLLTGSVIMFISFFILGALIKYIEIDQAAVPPGVEAPVGGKGYVSMIMLYIFAIGYEISWGPLVFVICAEIYPTRIRAICMSITIAIFWAMNTVIAKVTPLMITNLTYKTYFFFGSTVFAMTVFTWLFIPETRNRSLEDMEPIFTGPAIVLRNKEAIRTKDKNNDKVTTPVKDTNSSTDGEQSDAERGQAVKDDAMVTHQERVEN